MARRTRWIVTAGRDDRRFEFMRDHGVVVAGWSSTGAVEPGETVDALRDRMATAYPDGDPERVASWAEQLHAFATRIEPGDEVAIPRVAARTLSVGTVTGPYRFDAAAPENRRHQIPVEWDRDVPFAHVDDDVRTGLASGRSVFPVGAPVRGRGVSRRTVLLAGAGVGAAAVAVGLAAAKPWDDGSGSPSASGTGTTPTTRRATGNPAVRATPDGPVAQWLVDENAKPGTTAWSVGNPGRDGDIEGYVNVVSTPKGTPVTLYVSTVDPSFHVEAYRLGYYGGRGGRLVWQSGTQPGTKQEPGTFTAGVNMVEARWNPSLQVPVDARFPPGVYFLKLVGSSGVEHLVPLTVRDDTSTATYVVQCSVTNWQAYNDWGGYSLYKGADGAFDTRARVVSFDRPYRLGAGQADFLGLDFPLIMLMEQLGLDMTYSTDVDTHAHPELLLRHKAFFSHGHDEYWSKEMRDGVTAARDAGVNLVFFGSNALFRQIRFDASPLGPNRRQICYKSDDDPIRQTDPSRTTVNWREPPVNRPESDLIGELYESNPVRADMIVVDPGAWLFEGLGLTAGQALPGVVGSEYDHYLPSQVGPKNVQILCHSPLVCRGVKSYADMTYYSAPSGAGVLATGTLDWIPSLNPATIGGQSYNETVVAMTKKILAAWGNAKVGALHPSVPNYDAIAQRYGTAVGLASGTD